MARLPFIEDDSDNPNVQNAFQTADNINGRVANSMRLFAHSPAILKFRIPIPPLSIQLKIKSGLRKNFPEADATSNCCQRTRARSFDSPVCCG